jgi:ATP-dependent exoDNAse (exonuclease V) alpha subunit
VQELAPRHPESSRDTLAMAIFHLHIASISRGAGRSGPGAAAYRAGERIRDERTGVLHNYSHRADVSYKEILLPSGVQGSNCAWAMDRANLWNAAERAERRHDARVAREYQVTLPFELNADQRLRLARCLAQELAERHNVAIDLAVHAPPSGGDPRNHHAHLLATSREVTVAGFGGKAGLDMVSSERQRRGLPVGIAEMKAVRERWATLSNQALAAAGLQERIDHRSLRAQGIDREPLPYIPAVFYYMERRGVRSEIAERIRERYRARVQARLARAAGQTGARQASSELDLEQVRRQARGAWLELRGRAPEGSIAGPRQVHIKESLRESLPTGPSGAESASATQAAAQPRTSAAALECDAADQDLAL